MKFEGSISWRGFIKHYPWIGMWILWKLGRSDAIRNGIDTFVSGEETYKLSSLLINFLAKKGFKNLTLICKNVDMDLGPTQLLTYEYLGLQVQQISEWENYIMGFKRIRLSEAEDSIEWNQKNDVMVLHQENPLNLSFLLLM